MQLLTVYYNYSLRCWPECISLSNQWKFQWYWEELSSKTFFDSCVKLNSDTIFISQVMKITVLEHGNKLLQIDIDWKWTQTLEVYISISIYLSIIYR